MFNLIEKIRQESDSKKRLIAFGLSFLITGIIFIFWLVVVLPSSRQKEIIENNKYTGPIKDFSKTFGVLWGGIKQNTALIKESLKGIDLSSSIEYKKDNIEQ